MSARERMLLGMAALVVVLAVVGGLVYTVGQADVTALRWWAGVATVVVPLVGLAGYSLGRMEARGHVAGLAEGIEAVSKAAYKAADVRVMTTRRMKERAPVPTVQQMFLPGGGAGGAGVIIPPRRRDEDVEL